MTGGGNIKNGDIHAVVDHVEDFAHQNAGADGDRLSRLKVYFQIVLFLEIFHQFHKAVKVVAVTGNVMATPQVEPLHSGQEAAEFFLKGASRPFQRFKQLFAEGVEVKPFNPA